MSTPVRDDYTTTVQSLSTTLEIGEETNEQLSPSGYYVFLTISVPNNGEHQIQPGILVTI
jgi:hypothetical protein